MSKISKKSFKLPTILLFLVLLLSPFFLQGKGQVLTANADFGDLIKIERYDATFVVSTDRKVKVVEKFDVHFLTSNTSMFYRSFPVKGAMYEDITAKCEGNPDFYYNVKSNPDNSDFFDVNCIGGVHQNAKWTYEISYVMQDATGKLKDGMFIDLVGFGWQVPLHNVTINVQFPQPLTTSDYFIYVGGYGVDKENSRQLDKVTLSADGKKLTIQEDLLTIVYNGHYNEANAEGITLGFSYGGGVFDSYFTTRFFTDDMLVLVLVGTGCLVAAICILFLTKKKRELIPVVNIAAPDAMDPLTMGSYIDGQVDNEDVTSMIYYFADKGYLKIDFSVQDDPKLVSNISEFPKDEPIYQRQLFLGLFHAGKKEVKISELKGQFFDCFKIVKAQAPSLRPMYEKKSIWGYVAGGIIACLFAVISVIVLSMQVGKGYVGFDGIILLFPLIFSMLIGFIKENYRYKWKKRIKWFWTIVEWGAALIFLLVFLVVDSDFFMTEYEKLAIVLFSYACCISTRTALSRTEKCVGILGQILGFKEFIIVTEQDKIKVMLEENPELYYKILPYAQVLGVTDEWEEKFKGLTLEPPSWYVGHSTLLDYLILRSCLHNAMHRARINTMNANRSGGGRFVGRSGGGGRFGGFGGGGFGGGGGGAR